MYVRTTRIVQLKGYTQFNNIYIISSPSTVLGVLAKIKILVDSLPVESCQKRPGNVVRPKHCNSIISFLTLETNSASLLLNNRHSLLNNKKSQHLQSGLYEIGGFLHNPRFHTHCPHVFTDNSRVQSLLKTLSSHLPENLFYRILTPYCRPSRYLRNINFESGRLLK